MRHDLKVLNPVVSFDSIDMVNPLRFIQCSSNMFLHYQSMFQLKLPTDSSLLTHVAHSIAIWICPTSRLWSLAKLHLSVFPSVFGRAFIRAKSLLWLRGLKLIRTLTTLVMMNLSRQINLMLLFLALACVSHAYVIPSFLNVCVWHKGIMTFNVQIINKVWSLARGPVE